MHAFPNVDNAPSNAICRKLGFELLEECEFEFPRGALHDLQRPAPGRAPLDKELSAQAPASPVVDGISSRLAT